MLERKKILLQFGVTLVELMIGVVLGLLVSLATFTIYANASRTNIYTARLAELNEETRAMMDIMTSDIRRAGYWGDASKSATNPFTVPNQTNVRLPHAGCIIYSYDFNSNGDVDSGADFFGFTHIGNEIRAMSSSAISRADSVADCSDIDYFPEEAVLNNPAMILVQSLTFSTEGSQCIAYEAGYFKVSDTNTFITYAAPADSIIAPCDHSSLIDFPDRTEIRQIKVSLQTIHAADEKLIKSLEETVLIRNNRFIGGS